MQFGLVSENAGEDYRGWRITTINDFVPHALNIAWTKIANITLHMYFVSGWLVIQRFESFCTCVRVDLMCAAKRLS
jgi:hypothetical protein